MPEPARILVVDDEPLVRDFVSRALQSAGYEVVSMTDGAAALDAVTTAVSPYDLIVTNNCMPHLSGAELIEELRRRYPALPILHLDDESQCPSPVLPADVPNLSKPFGIDPLLKAVEKVLSIQHSPSLDPLGKTP
jgi:CheY-like chemotaxis protein